MSWQYEPHQISIGEEAIDILQDNGWVYLGMEERTRKTGVAIWMCENLHINRILVVTPSKAIRGWEEHIANLPIEREYDIISMDSLSKATGKYDMVIVDEAHNFGSTTRTKKKGHKTATGSSRRLVLKKLAKGLPIIFMSATPSAQGWYQLYEQLGISSWSPWKRYKTFYSWFDDYGIPEVVYTKSGPRTKRVAVKEDMVKKDLQGKMVTYTREQLGFEQTITDKVHLISPPEIFKAAYNSFVKTRALRIGEALVVSDTKQNLRSKLHQMEGGTIKYINEDGVEDTIILQTLFKIDYIKANWEDTSKLAIMYNYIAEGALLKQHFKNAEILQGTSYAEGVNLSHIDTIVVYSMDFKTVKYIQRRARQVDMHAKGEIVIHYLNIDKAISSEVYETVAKNKANYTDKHYQGLFL